MDAQARRRERRAEKQAQWKAANPLLVGVSAKPVNRPILSLNRKPKSRVESALNPIDLTVLAEYHEQIESNLQRIERKNQRTWYSKPRSEMGVTCVGRQKMKLGSNKAWKGALKRAGISNFRFHDLRHTWASWLVQSGVSLLALKEMGGWETLEMVQRYAHLSAGHLTEHASKIDAIISRNGTNTAQEENVVYLNAR